MEDREGRRGWAGDGSSRGLRPSKGTRAAEDKEQAKLDLYMPMTEGK